MTDAQRKKRAERIIECYKENYAEPFWKAYKDKNHMEMGRLLSRSHDFKFGLFMADPHGKWHQRLNKVDIELKKQICPEEDDP